MQINLQGIIPTFFEPGQITTSEVWGKDLQLLPGQDLFIVAPSGSGKTSFMHFIYGLRKDYKGTISYNDNNIRKFSIEKFSGFRQNSISIVFQDLRLFPDQTARQNIEIKRQLNPYHPPGMIDEMARRLGIESRLDKLARICSYGEQQRIAIIRSLMQPFEFLLLDEPFSNLDEKNRVKAFELIAEECKKRNASMIFADLKKLEFFNSERVVNL